MNFQQHERLGSAHLHLARLQQLARAGDKVSARTFERTVVDLQNVLEQLEVAIEQLSRQQKELAESRRRSECLFNFLPGAALTTDAEGMVLEANNAAVDLFHLSKRFLAGRSMASFLAGDRQEFVNLLGRLAPGSHVLDWELWLRPRERKSIQVRAAVRVVGEPNAPPTLLWLLSPAR